MLRRKEYWRLWRKRKKNKCLKNGHAMMRLVFWSLIVMWTVVSAPGSPGAQDYVLGEGDVITINVYEHPDLSNTVRISGEGTVNMPLIGKVRAADLSMDDLEADIEKRLADGYIVNPQVNIFIEEFRSRKATILGEIDSPGLYEITGQTSLLEIISNAGGLTPDAADTAIIHRQPLESEKDEVKRINLKQLMRDGQSTRNVQIVAGDNIYIPKKEQFYVTGEVEKPGSYNFEEGMSVIKALSEAGGATDKGALNRTKIIRMRNGQEHELKKVKMNMPIKPNDVIVVPESYI